MQAKPDNGGERPITITSLVYAVLCKLSKSAVQDWDAEHHGFWDTAIAGSSALKAAVARRLMAERAVALGQAALELMFDIEKFYDSIDIVLLVQESIRMEYPVHEMLNGLVAHRLPRVIKVGNDVSLPVDIRASILQGCMRSNSWARMYVHKMLEDMHYEIPFTINQFVDDMAATIVGKMDDVAHCAAQLVVEP